MAEQETPTSLVSFKDLLGLSKPCTVLVEKISDAVGGLCRPWQMKRLAITKAEVEVMKTHKSIQITDIKQRAILRFGEEQIQYQRNMEAVVKKALLNVDEDAQPNNIENDWLTYLFDKARIVSDNQMQNVWARILAGEANAPGSFSKRSINLVSEMGKRDAEMLNVLRQFCWEFGDQLVLVVPEVTSFGDKHGLDFACLRHLESLGLISFSDDIFGGGLVCSGRSILGSYFGKALHLHREKDEWAGDTISVGSGALTPVAHELLRLCAVKPIKGMLKQMTKQWERYSPKAG
ncbi:MAG: DUF2806 domain-containing protein [Prosthecobacter sp.]